MTVVDDKLTSNDLCCFHEFIVGSVFACLIMAIPSIETTLALPSRKLAELFFGLKTDKHSGETKHHVHVDDLAAEILCPLLSLPRNAGALARRYC
jgi:hypothetical protein